MAVKALTCTYTMPVGKLPYLHTIFGIGDRTWIRSLTMRAARSNAGDIYWKDATEVDGAYTGYGQSGGYLGPGEAATVDLGDGQGLAGDYVISSDQASDVVYLTITVNREAYDRGL